MNPGWAIAAALGLLAGCAAQPPVERPRLIERVVLLPSDTDRPSAVVVRSGDAEILLDTPYTSADVRGAVLETQRLSAEEVASRYRGLLSAQPPKPQPFTIYFELGTDEFTPASKLDFEAARQIIATWTAVEVVVIGHTDRMGAADYNDKLSHQRARKVAQRLVAAGVAAEAIQIAARGEREPLVPTPDGVPEPRNRRVEIKVR
jgi:outer membrane protein OmpA-like peptidoglycan-associated protein